MGSPADIYNTRALVREGAPTRFQPFVYPPSTLTEKLIQKYYHKSGLLNVSLYQPSDAQRANRLGGAYSAWSRCHMDAGVILPLHPFFCRVVDYFGIFPF